MAVDDDLVVSAVGVCKTYTPSPGWLRLLAKSPITSPVEALRDVDLELRRGQICAVVGPNGAGKTTLFRVVAGLTTADTGQVRVAGLDPTNDGRRVRAMLGWMPSEKRSLFLRQTSRENLAFHGRLHGIPEADLARRIDEVLELVGLEGKANAAPQSFSDGMRSRLLLARALLHRPDLLLLDEPTGPIDPVAAYKILSLIVDLVQELQIGALISSHRLEEISTLQGRVVLLDKGRTVFDGDLRSVVGQETITVLRLRDADTAEAAHRRLAGGTDVVERLEIGADPCTVRFVRPPDVAVGRLVQAATDQPADIVSVTEEQRPLRDVLASFYDVGSRP